MLLSDISSILSYGQNNEAAVIRHSIWEIPGNPWPLARIDAEDLSEMWLMTLCSVLEAGH